MTGAGSYRRLLQGGGLVTLGNVVAAGLGLVLLLLLARALSPADLALVMGAIVVIDGGQMFLDATVNTGMVTLASRHGVRGAPQPGLLRAGFWTKVVLGVGFALVMAGLSGPMSMAMLGNHSMAGLVALAGVMAGFAGMHGFVLAVLTAHEAFGRIALVSFWKNLFRIVAVTPFLAMGGTPDARAMALAICGATVMTLLVSAGTVSWSFLRASGRLRDGMLALLRVNGWMLLAAFAMLGGRLDVWLVGTLGTPAQAGLYAVAAQLCVGVGIVTQALVTTALPSVSRFQTAGEVRDFLVRSTRLLLPLFLLPLVAWPIAAPVIGGVFGAAYAGSAGAFTVLLLAAIMTLAGAPLMLVLLSLGEARVMAYGALAQFALRVALAVPMVPAWGAVGLGVADVASRLIAMAAISHFIWRALQRQMVPAVVAP
jgi:O-antigen/teichoic acid export membrane protein